jgi:ADP-heptose:LPS heptosyltransferase
LSGARYKVGFNVEGRGFLLTTKVHENSSLHQIERNLSLAKAIGAGTEDTRLEIQLSDEDKRYVQSLLGENKVTQEDLLIGIYPSAPWPPRRWDIEKFAEVINWLIEKFNSKVLIIGGNEDLAVLNGLKRLINSENIIDYVGKTTLKQAALLLQKCKFFLGVDSGPMHLAVAVGTPVICLMGPGEYPRFAPYGNNHIVIRKEVGCNPCVQDYDRQICKRGINICMKSISVGEVKSAIVEFLKTK